MSPKDIIAGMLKDFAIIAVWDVAPPKSIKSPMTFLFLQYFNASTGDKSCATRIEFFGSSNKLSEVPLRFFIILSPI